MRERFLPTDTVTSNAALCSYEQSGRWEDALKSQTADVISYTAVMNACADAGQWAQALQLHRWMLQDGHPPTADTCSAVIRSCDGERWREQLELLREMRRRGLQPSAAALNAAVRSCSAANQWRDALEVMSSMWEKGFQPEALRLFRLRQSFSASPENETYAAAIRACGSQWIHALELLSKRWETGLADAQCYDAAIACCEAGGRWDEVLRLFDEMEGYNLKPSCEQTFIAATCIEDCSDGARL
eukprot:Skav212824  [mRNA]  locus=scaffold5083:149845:155893:- [translate_table: standard]